MIDIVVLVNELRAMVQGNPDSLPSKAELATAFKTYQTLRKETVVAECAQSGQATVTATWQTGVHKFIDRKVFARHFLQRFLINSGAKKLAATPTLDFVPCRSESSGRIPWKNSVPRVVIAA